MNVHDQLKKLNLSLPPCPSPAGIYRPVVIDQGVAYISGQISKDAQGSVISGKCGLDLNVEQGQEAAKIAALNVLSIMHNLIGFDKVQRILKMTGYVQAAPDFYQIPSIVNGASELFGQVLGDSGSHARSAVGVASLPLNAAVELEVTVKLL